MRTSTLTVLMYHALHGGDIGSCADADPHYAVSRDTFRRHLLQIQEAGRRPASVAGILNGGGGTDATVLTFDDGHASNAEAAEDIISAGGSADFFINPAMAGRRNYLGWPELRALADQGLSIQSHGQTHRFFDELSEAEIRQELLASKKDIEDHLGRAVTLFAPPGGRLTAKVAGIAEQLGYRGICNSRVGLWHTARTPWKIPRFAVLATTSDSQFNRWILQDPREVAKLKFRNRVLDTAKYLLGNRRYERLRARLLPGRDSSGKSA